MNKKLATPTQSTQFRAQEEAAFHAWREWPVFLALRRKELLMHRGTSPTPSGSDATATVKRKGTG